MNATLRPVRFGLPVLLLAFGVTGLSATSAQACAPDTAIGSICMTAAPKCPPLFQPLNTAPQPLSTEAYEQLYATIGNIYGGSPLSKRFYLPDLAGKLPVGTSGSLRLGETVSSSTTLTVDNLPSHTHVSTYKGDPGSLRGSATIQVGTQPDTDHANATPANGLYLTPMLSSGRGRQAFAWSGTPEPQVSIGGVSASIAGALQNAQAVTQSAGSGASFNMGPPQLGMLTCMRMLNAAGK